MRSFKSLFKAVKSIFQIRAARRSNPGKTPVLALFSVFIFSRKFTRFHAALKPIFRSLKPFQVFSSLFNLRARVFSFYMNTYTGSLRAPWPSPRSCPCAVRAAPAPLCNNPYFRRPFGIVPCRFDLYYTGFPPSWLRAGPFHAVKIALPMRKSRKSANFFKKSIPCTQNSCIIRTLRHCRVLE